MKVIIPDIKSFKLNHVTLRLIKNTVGPGILVHYLRRKHKSCDNKLVARGPNVARRTVQSGPWLDSEINIK